MLTEIVATATTTFGKRMDTPAISNLRAHADSHACRYGAAVWTLILEHEK
jgi:hypothetical protein